MTGAPASAVPDTRGTTTGPGAIAYAPDRPPAAEGPPRRDGAHNPSHGPTPGPGPGPAPSVGIRLLDAPVARKDDSRAYKYIVDHVRPGTTIERRVRVQNLTEARRPVAVYAAAAEVTGDGFVFAPGRTQNELSSWTTVDRPRLDLAPDESADVLVRIEVPKRAEAGERYAVVWAEVSGAGGRTIRNVGRVGVRVYLSVGPGGEPRSGFEIGPLVGSRDEDGTPVVTAEVRNTGLRALDLGGELHLTDGPGGLSVGPVRADVRTLALGGTGTVRVVLDRRLPDGSWAAKLNLASGWTRRSASGTISFGGGGRAAAATPVDRSGQVLTGGLVTSALVLALFAAHVYRRRSRLRELAPAA